MSSESEHFQILVIGGGTAGITVAAQILKKDPNLKVGIVEPSDKHYYQPAWTLVGAGTYSMKATIKDQKDFIPSKAVWLKTKAQSFEPDDNVVTTSDGKNLRYDHLIVAPGIQINYGGIPGLAETIGKNGVTTNYDPRYAEYTWELLRKFKGGNALFTQANTPVKCGGAPQKIMYLAEDYFRKQGIRDNANVILALPGTVIFGVKKFADALMEIIRSRGILDRYYHNLVEIRGEKKEAVYELLNLEEGQEVELNAADQNIGVRKEGPNRFVIPYEIMHLAPPQSAPDFVKNSPLADKSTPWGWVDVNKSTLQHNKYPNVWSLGDVSSLPNAKTGAAVRKQAPILVNNLFDYLRDEKLNPKAKVYNGYGSCPLVTRYGRMMLAEFDYDNNPTPSFPINLAKERYSMWVMKKYMLPWLYWNMMLKGKEF